MVSSECSSLAFRWNEDLTNDRNPFSPFDCSHLNERYRLMRESLIALFDQADSACVSLSRQAYKFDLTLALGLYEYMQGEGMTAREASDDGIWRYIQMKVVPDQIVRRWKLDNRQINDDRFWKKTWRLYLKILWWYVHLSYAGSINQTYEVLKDNSSNDISQLVERSGEGFRLDLTREIMRQFATISSDQRGSTTLSHILMMNNSMCTCVDPDLCGMSKEEYVNDLFKRCGLR